MIRFGLILLLIAATLWSAALFGYARYIAALNTETPQNMRAEGIIVLTGGDGRIAAGRALLEAGAAPELFISGVGAGVRLDDIMPDLAPKFACCVLIGYTADDTHGNALEAQRWLHNHNRDARRMFLVTAHYHLPRALWYFSRLMPKVTWLPVAVEPHALEMEHWYRSLLGWQLLSSELIKFIATVLHV